MATDQGRPLERAPEGKAATFKLWWEYFRKARRERWGDPMGYLFIAPGLILFAVFQIWVLIRGFTMAFTDFSFVRQLVRPTRVVGIRNFIEFATDDMWFWPSFGRALYFTAIYMPLMLGSALLFASVVARVKRALVAGFFRTIMYLPVILPTAVAILMWQVLLNNQMGYVNHILRNILGLEKLALNWLNRPDTALPAIAVTRIWKDAGYSAMLFLIGMYAINDELYEAAAIDGASAFKQWWYITLPMLKPVIALVLILNANLISAAQDFMIMYGPGSFGPEGSCLTLGYYIWVVAFLWGNMRMGYAAAMSLFLGVISMLLSGVVFKLFRTERA